MFIKSLKSWVTGAGVVFQRRKAVRPSDCHLCHGEDRHRHNRSIQRSAAKEAAQGAGGHLARLGAQGRLPDEPGSELSPNKKQDCLGNSTKNTSGEEAAATAERQGGVSQCGSLVELPSRWVRLTCTHYTPIFPILPWEALILTRFPTAMNKGLHANQN